MGLNEKFGLPVVQKDTVDANFVEVGQDNSALKDFEVARQNITKLIDVGTIGVQSLGDLAESGQLPEYYLALSAMIKSTTYAASSLIKLHEQIQTLKNPTENRNAVVPKESHSHIHFSGSTNDLSQFVKDLNEEGKKK